jgi:class 3 adenylate cyclase
MAVCYSFFCYQFGVFSAKSAGPGLLISRKSLAAYLIFLTLSGFLILMNCYIHIRSEILAFNNINLGSSTVVKIKNFVERLIPKHIQDSIGAEGTSGEIAENVTLLFADIVGFTAYSAGRTPLQVVNMLSQLFTAFDIECSRLNLYKVYTIGDCYVVMSFVDKNNRLPPEKECVAVVELGFKMIEIIARVREEIKFDGLHMRIGVHTGKIYGGLVGTGIIRYDLFGQDVLIANKIESSGKSDALHISDATKLMLDRSDAWNKYYAEKDADVEIKALGRKIGTYFLEKKDQNKNKTDLQKSNK